jgi:hypothetical protein
MLRTRPRNPAIPGNRTDRTGSREIQRRAAREIRQRYAGLQAEALAIFARIRWYEVNEARVVYGLTPDEMAAVNLALREALDRWIASGREVAHTFWWAKYDADAARLGATQAVSNLSALSASYAAAKSLEAVVFSQPFRNRVAMAQIKSYEHWTGVSAEVKSELSQIIGRAVVDGRNPRAVRKEIMERLDVSKSRAMSFAQTDITDTLRQARWAEADQAKEELGLNLGLLWTSALIPTTRDHHAARNGKVYTSEECRDFYDRDGNRYNCFLPGTLVSGRFVAGIKSRYKGPAVRLVTAGGRELAVTANHPVLTAAGMMPAAEIREGDKLVAYGGQVQRALGVGNLHSGLMGARIEDVFGALVDAGHQFSARVRAVDLHGDAAFAEPDVDVVRAKRELVFAPDAAAFQLLDDLALMLADAPAPAGRSGDLLGHAGVSTAGGAVGRGGVGPALFGGRARRANLLGLTDAAGPDAHVSECALDDAAVYAGAPADRQHGLPGQMCGHKVAALLDGGLPAPLVVPEPGAVQRFHDRAVADPQALRDLLHRFAGLASFDEVVDVHLFQYEGHVFDLQERSGLMLGSNIVASNCYCGQTEALLDENGRPILTDTLKWSMSKELAEWKKAREK